jgi:hypothetical protein
MSTTLPADTTGEVILTVASPTGIAVSDGTFLADFTKIRHVLSDKPLHRPNRTRPIRVVTNEELKRIAAENPPPPEWFEGEEDRPF